MATRLNLIHEILGKGNIEVIKSLLDQGALDDPQDPKDSSPLEFAIFMGYKDIVELLLDYGEDIDFVSKEDRTPLMQAVYWGKEEITQLLIDRGAFINKSADRWSENVFKYTFSKSNYSILKSLLEAGFDLNRLDNYDIASHAMMFDEKVLKLLFEQGLYLDEKDKRFFDLCTNAWLYKKLPMLKKRAKLFKEYNDQKGLKPLPWYKRFFSYAGKREVFEAVQLGQTKKLKTILKNNELDDQLKLELLYEAIKRNQYQVAHLLIEEKAPLYDKENEKMSPLLYAIEKRRNLIALLLIDKNADIHFKAKGDKETLLFKAVQKLEVCVMDKLLEKGAPINEGNGCLSPLMKAVQQKRGNHFNYLVEMKANLDLQDEEGNTPLMKAIENGFIIGAQTLIFEGADMLIKNKAGEDAYQIAMKKGNISLAKLIRKQLTEKLKTQQKKAQVIQTHQGQAPVILMMKNEKQRQKG